MKILWQSKNGFYKLVLTELDHVRLDDDKNLFSDYPILYDSLRVAYDYPYHWPKYVKTAVSRIMINRYMDEVN